MNIDELNVYKLSMEIGEKVWNIVVKWDYFAKDTVGKQLYCINWQEYKLQ